MNSWYPLADFVYKKPGLVPSKASIFECIKVGLSFLLIDGFPTFQLFGLSQAKKWEKVDKYM